MARRIRLRHNEKARLARITQKAAEEQAARDKVKKQIEEHRTKKNVYPLYTREALIACEDMALLGDIATFYGIKIHNEMSKRELVDDIVHEQYRYRVSYNTQTR